MGDTSTAMMKRLPGRLLRFRPTAAKVPRVVASTVASTAVTTLL